MGEEREHARSLKESNQVYLEDFAAPLKDGSGFDELRREM